VRERVYSQEINIISPDTGKFKYVIGGYAQRNKVDLRNWNSTNGGFTSLPHPNTSKLLLGAFGQATYQLTEKLSVDAGLRYSRFEVTDQTRFTRGAGQHHGHDHRRSAGGRHRACPQTGHEGDGRDGKMALNYKPDADNLIYAFVARGYKNGGINPPTGTFAPKP
jgi:iron complex outermembrane receptor protein